MRSLRIDGSSEMRWSRLLTSPECFALQSEGEILGALTRETKSLFLGLTPEGRWRFARAGGSRDRVSIRAEGARRDCAALRMITSGLGTLQHSDGRRLSWTQTDLWRKEFSFRDARGVDLVRTRVEGLDELRMSFDSAARDIQELPLLVLLSPYLTLGVGDAAVSTECLLAATDD